MLRYQRPTTLLVWPLILLSRSSGQRTPTVHYEASHFDTIVSYITWDGTKWVARRNGDSFIHWPDGDPSQRHHDFKINYLTWDRSKWSAKIVNGHFVHAPDGDWTRAHNDSILNYVNFVPGFGIARWQMKLESNGFRHAPADVFSRKRPKQRSPTVHYEASHFDTIVSYITWDGTKWVARRNGDSFIHWPDGDPSQRHDDFKINYLTWDRSKWSAKIVNGHFVHAPDGDWTRAHNDSILNYVNFVPGFGIARWQMKLESNGFRHAPVDVLPAPPPPPPSNSNAKPLPPNHVTPCQGVSVLSDSPATISSCSPYNLWRVYNHNNQSTTVVIRRHYENNGVTYPDEDFPISLVPNDVKPLGCAQWFSAQPSSSGRQTFQCVAVR